MITEFPVTTWLNHSVPEHYNIIWYCVFWENWIENWLSSSAVRILVNMLRIPKANLLSNRAPVFIRTPFFRLAMPLVGNHYYQSYWENVFCEQIAMPDWTHICHAIIFLCLSMPVYPTVLFCRSCVSKLFSKQANNVQSSNWSTLIKNCWGRLEQSS